MNHMKRSLSSKIFDFCNVLFMILLCVTFIMPFWFVITGSFASEHEFMRTGGLILWNEEWDPATYKFLIAEGRIFKSMLLTIARLAIVVPYNLSLTMLLAYAISHKDLPGLRILMPILIFFNYFSGGLIPTLQNYKELGLYDSYWVLILPVGCSVSNALILRNHINTIPDSLAESARLDGASELTILTKIIVPLCKPGLATIGLFVAVGTWNDWYSGIVYLKQDRTLPLQTFLRKMITVSTQDLESLGAALRMDTPVPETLKMAAIVLTTLPIVMVYPFVQKYFVKGMLIGSVKE